MNYEQRQAAAKASIAKTEEVLRVGQERGIWTVGEKSGNDTFIAATVLVNGYLPFLICGGGWNAENKISADVGSLKVDGIEASKSDVNANGFEAMISSSKSADQIIKDIGRRVTNNAQALLAAAKVHKEVQDRLDARKALHEHVAKLEKVGFQFGQLEKRNHYQAEGLRKGGARVRVTSGGSVTLETWTTVDALVDVIDKL